MSKAMNATLSGGRRGELSGWGTLGRGGGQKRGGRERRGMTREYEQSLLREIGCAPFFFLALGALWNSICRGDHAAILKLFDSLVLLRPTLELCIPPLFFPLPSLFFW